MTARDGVRYRRRGEDGLRRRELTIRNGFLAPRPQGLGYLTKMGAQVWAGTMGVLTYRICGYLGNWARASSFLSLLTKKHYRRKNIIVQSKIVSSFIAYIRPDATERVFGWLKDSESVTEPIIMRKSRAISPYILLCRVRTDGCSDFEEPTRTTT